jgi:hypothetical protein
MRPRPAVPCDRGTARCRFWASAHWWSWAGLDWADYWWHEYEQYGGDPP